MVAFLLFLLFKSVYKIKSEVQNQLINEARPKEN